MFTYCTFSGFSTAATGNDDDVTAATEVEVKAVIAVTDSNESLLARDMCSARVGCSASAFSDFIMAFGSNLRASSDQ